MLVVFCIIDSQVDLKGTSPYTYVFKEEKTSNQSHTSENVQAMQEEMGYFIFLSQAK